MERKIWLPQDMVLLLPGPLSRLSNRMAGGGSQRLLQLRYNLEKLQKSARQNVNSPKMLRMGLSRCIVTNGSRTPQR